METVPCRICSTPTARTARLCSPCWELSCRVKDATPAQRDWLVAQVLSERPDRDSDPTGRIVAAIDAFRVAFHLESSRLHTRPDHELVGDWARFWLKRGHNLKAAVDRARSLLDEARRQCAGEAAADGALVVGAMRFDGSKESAEAVAAWVRLADDPEDDALFSWITTDGTGQVPHDAQLATNDGHVDVEPGDWIVRLGRADFIRVRPSEDWAAEPRTRPKGCICPDPLGAPHARYPDCPADHGAEAES